MMTAYDEIELFGLTENGADDLPIPMDDEICEDGVRAAFLTLFETIKGTGLQSEVEPLAHAFATIFQRRATKLADEADKIKLALAALIKSQDGSEIAEQELEDHQRRFEITFEKSEAIARMAETAAECYEGATGNAYIPVTGNRSTSRARETGAIFEARQFLEQKDREQAERNRVPEGPRIAVDGATDWDDVDTIWNRLDRAHELQPKMVLVHKGGKGGTAVIASRWARARKVDQIVVAPRWKVHGKAAPFKANDEILSMKPMGAIIFGGNGVAMNLGQKAEQRHIHVSWIRAKE